MVKRIAIGIGLVAGLAAQAAAAAAHIPADIVWIQQTAGRGDTTRVEARRVLVRFDLGRVTNGEKITRATLRLVERPGYPIAGDVEARPITTDWGGMSAAFLEHEDAWTKANREGTLPELAWQQQGRPAKYDTGPGFPEHRERFLIGDVDWRWALYPVRRWKTPGGDADAPLKARGRERLDVTLLVKSWIGSERPNHGVLLQLADESDAPALDLDGALLELEGPGVAVETGPRLDLRPNWVPATYKVQHPRFAYPDAEWLAKAKANPRVLDRMGKAEQLVLRQRLNPSPEGAKAIADFVGRDKPFKYSYWSDIYGMAILYDWGYDLLSEADRQCLAIRLRRLAEHTKPPGTPLNAPGNRGGAKSLWCAIAVYPDVPGARRSLWVARAHWIDATLPLWHWCLGDQGGFWHEQCIPYRTFVSNVMCDVLWSWPPATGDDLWRKNPWWEGIVTMPLFGARPDGTMIRHSLMYPGENPGGVGPIVTATQVYQNPYGPGVRDGLTPTAKPWGPPLATEFPHKSRDALPLTWYTQGGLGFTFMRSDWSEDGTFIWFKCGITGRAHNLLDAGHFSIYKRAPLAVNAGSYLGGNITAYTVYSHLAISKNVITVTDPNEQPLKVSWMRNNVEDGLIPNDGGQRWTASKFGSGTPWSLRQVEEQGNLNIGRVLAYQPGKAFSYVCGDLTEAYTGPLSGTDAPQARSKRVRKFLRTLLFLPPDHLVVFDQVESFNKDFKKRWLLHTVNEPEIQGVGDPPSRSPTPSLITVTHTETVFRNMYAAHSWGRDLTYAIRATAEHAFFKAHPDCQYYGPWQPQLYQYDGVMFVRPLLPERPEIVKIGGPGKEFWINGQNYADAYREVASHEGIRHPAKVDQPYLVSGEVGRWRLEVSPSTPAENDRFLNVFQVGIASGHPRPTMSRLVPAKNGTGVEVDLGGGRTATVVFKPGIGGHITITRNGRPVVDEDLAERVLPNPPRAK